jgi:Cu(I)/Ag(I) efflux system protein CusF
LIPVSQAEQVTSSSQGQMMNMSGNMGNMKMGQDVQPATPVYSAQGHIQAWGKKKVTIAHQAIAALNWPAMTMSFALPSSPVFTELAAGSAVHFSFIQTAQGYQLTAITADK